MDQYRPAKPAGDCMDSHGCQCSMLNSTSHVGLAASYDTASNSVGYPVQRDSRRVLHPLALPSQYISSRCLSKVPASRYHMLCDWRIGKEIMCSGRLSKDIHINVAGVCMMQTT